MLYLTCTTITSVDLAHYEVSRAKDWVSVDCGIILCKSVNFLFLLLSARVSHPVSEYKEYREENVGSPVTIRAAVN